MYIQPNSNVWIFRDVPFCESYEDTMDFSSASQQWTYLADNYYAFMFSKYSYQRAMLNSIKVEKKYEDIYDCNYMAFTNISYEHKVFYAFIKELKYINDNVTEIIYEIDPMQTWMFDYTLGECFVEREHTADDTIGANLIPENLATGEYEYNYCYNSLLATTPTLQAEDLKDLCVVLFATIDEEMNDIQSGDFDGSMYSGLYPVYKGGASVSPAGVPTTNPFADVPFTLTDTGMAALQWWMDFLPASRINAIAMAVIMPLKFVSVGSSTGTKFVGSQSLVVNKTMTRADGNQVRNNKCLCYPYNCLYVSNNQGKEAVYHYEYFTTVNDVLQFSIYGDRTPNASYILVPKDYKGISLLFEEGLTISNYPQVALNVDGFKAWLAQNAGSIATSALTMVYTQQLETKNATEQLGGRILKYGGIHGVIAGAVGGTLAEFQPPQSRGTQAGGMNVSAGIQNFYFYNRKVRPEFATIIDDYFQMFGYACHKVKTPTAHNRVKWDYVKTVGCTVHGDLPADEAKRIKNIYDNGIRFWHYGATMYDYNTDNPTVVVNPGDLVTPVDPI